MADPRELAERAFALLEDALRESEKRATELREQLGQRALSEGASEASPAGLDERLAAAEAERNRLQGEVARLEEVLAEERAKAEQLKSRLDIAESGPDKLTKKEINYWRSKVDEFDRTNRENKARIAELRREQKEREAELETQRAAADSAAAEIERIKETLKEREARMTQLSAELETVKAELAAKTAQWRQVQTELEGSDRDRQRLTNELTAAQEQISGLEQELRDEKECTDNLSEVANERRELITSLEDRLAEAEERYEEARWRLGKAQHFERLVKRRKKLIKALIERIRQKHKANVALKAGLDGLRTYKAAAEARQHELLKRIDKLTAKVKEHEETIARHHASTVAKEELFGAQSRINELEKRIEAQVEIIQTLEDELKTAKAMQQVRADYGAEVERLRAEVTKLRSELDAKNKIVERLENDADEQQRKLAKLRGTESETLRLKTQIKEQEAAIATLTEEVDGWKRKYEFMASDSSPPYRSAAEK